MDQVNTALQAWNLLITYLPWAVAIFLVCLFFIAISLAQIAGHLKDIAGRLKNLPPK